MCNSLRLAFGVFAALLAVACEATSKGARTAGEATEVANEYMAENLPQVRLQRQQVETIDMGDRWRVSYVVPEGGTGGPIILLVDKRSGEVVDGEITQ